MNNTFYCSSSTVCSSQPPALTDSVLNVMIANGALESEEYVEESRAIAEEYLYRELADDSVLWFSDSTYIQFMIENQGEPVAYLYDVEEYLRAAYQYDSTMMALIDSCNLQITILTDSLEKLYVEGLDDLVEQVIYTIGFLNQTINNINIQRESIITDNLANADYMNEFVVNGELPETNAAAVNDIEIYYLETGQDKQVLIDNYNELLSIAQQCPFVGGKAVYLARSYVSMFNDSVVYDDTNICMQQGYYRLAAKNSNIRAAEGIDIIPNPAKNYIDIMINKNTDGMCLISIIDNYSKPIYKEWFEYRRQKHRINTQGFANGIYQVQVTIEGAPSKTIKLVIVK